MTRNFNVDERLIERLLCHQDRDTQETSPGDHVDEESLAMFADGALDESERAQVTTHLADCPQCRQAVSLMLSLSEQMVAQARPPHTLPLVHNRILWAAAAASVLVVAGLVLWSPPGGLQVAERRTYGEVSDLLRRGQFDSARDALREAADEGIHSDRIQSLQAQAILEIRGTIALESTGRLTDFGFEIGGIAARSTTPAESLRKRKEAYQLLVDAGGIEARLNRGYVLLALDQPDKALDEFSELTSIHADQPLPYLGKGLAQYILENYAAAESAFKEVLRLAPDNPAATINLAMTLEEQGKLEEAVVAWEKLPLESFPESTQADIRRNIKELRTQLNR